MSMSGALAVGGFGFAASATGSDGSTSFTQDPEELKKKNLGYGQNKRSSEHLMCFKIDVSACSIE